MQVTYVLFDAFACSGISEQISWRRLLYINHQIAALKKRSCYHAENCDFQFTCQVGQNFHVFSILDHLNAMKVTVSPSSLAESHGICSAAGAIFVEKKTFNQSNGTMSIINSASERDGGGVHLGALPREMLFELALRLWQVHFECGFQVSDVVFDAFDCCDI